VSSNWMTPDSSPNEARGNRNVPLGNVKRSLIIALRLLSLLGALPFVVTRIEDGDFVIEIESSRRWVTQFLKTPT